MASPRVPEVWLHRRNWDFAIKFLPKEDRDLGREAIRIATFGMEIIFEGKVEELPRNVPNCIRTEDELLLVDCDFIEELWRGRRRVGARQPKYGQVRLLPVPKDETRIRLVSDASHGGVLGTSINHNMPQEVKSVSFALFTDLVRQAKNAGPDGWVFCVDGDAWFRQFGITSFAEDMLYYQHRGEGYNELREPFGPANAPKDAQTMSATVAKVTARWFLPEEEQVHDAIGSYVDDFWAFAKSAHLAWLLLWALLSAFWYLGLAVSLKKLQWPARRMKILGFIFDLPTQTVQIPAKKIEKARTRLQLVLDSPTTCRKDMERLLGILQWISAVAFPLRAMIRQSYVDLAAFPPGNYVPATLRLSTREQLEWWRCTIDELNWRPFDHILGFDDKSILNITADASTQGFGIWWDSAYVQYKWIECEPPWNRMRWIHINAQEAFAILAAVAILGPTLRGRYVRFITDNATVYWALEKLTTDSRPVMGAVRMTARAAIRNQFRWFTGWIGTKENRLADALSRSQWDLIDGLVDLSAKRRYNVPFDRMTRWLRREPSWKSLLRL